MASPSSEEPQQSQESQQATTTPVGERLFTRQSSFNSWDAPLLLSSRTTMVPSPRHLKKISKGLESRVVLIPSRSYRNSMGSRLRQNLQVAEIFFLGTFAGDELQS